MGSQKWQVLIVGNRCYESNWHQLWSPWEIPVCVQYSDGNSMTREMPSFIKTLPCLMNTAR